MPGKWWHFVCDYLTSQTIKRFVFPAHFFLITQPMHIIDKIIFSGLLISLSLVCRAQVGPLLTRMDKTVDALAPKLIGWRRDFHQHPELSNREFQTAGKVAAHLQSLGIEVKTGVAKTGVVGILKGGKPGPVVAFTSRYGCAAGGRTGRFAVQIDCHGGV